MPQKFADFEQSCQEESIFNSRPSVPPRSLLRQKENLLPPELQVNDDLVVPGKPKRITPSIEVRKIDVTLNKHISLRLHEEFSSFLYGESSGNNFCLQRLRDL